MCAQVLQVSDVLLGNLDSNIDFPILATRFSGPLHVYKSTI